jgi:hypothetical protein
LRKTVSLLVEKHAMLRTGFDMYCYNEPVQIVFKSIEPDIKHEDISHLRKVEREVYINARLNEEKNHPFNLEQFDTLWRIRTFTLDHENICLLFLSHHAIFDGWSFASLLTELNNTYLKLKSAPGYLPGKLKSSYRDYVIEEMREKRNEETLNFWRNELTGFKRLDFSKLVKEDGNYYENKSYITDLGGEYLEKLQKTAKKYDTSVMNLCFAAYVYILGILSFCDDIVVGISINNRPACEDGDKILGCFINHLPVRIKLPDKISWDDYIYSIDRKLNDLRKFQKLSFFEIVKVVGEEKQYQNPLFDTIFNFIDFFIYDELEYNGEAHAVQDKFHEELIVDTTAVFNTLFTFHTNTYRGFSYIIQYYSSVFDDKVIRILANCFKYVLNKFIDEPDATADKDNIFDDMKDEDMVSKFTKTKSTIERTDFNF